MSQETKVVLSLQCDRYDSEECRKAMSMKDRFGHVWLPTQRGGRTWVYKAETLLECQDAALREGWEITEKGDHCPDCSGVLR